jgi:hypothetical protein
MRPTEKKIHNLIQNLNDKTQPELDQKILDDCYTELDSQTSSAPTAGPNAWRIVMNKPITKFAAAIILLAVTLHLTIFDKPVSKAYAMNDVVEILQNAETIHCWGQNFIYDNFDEVGNTNEPNRVTFESWVDVKNTRYREQGFGTSRPLGGGKLTIETNEYMLLDGMMTYLSRTKNYVFYNLQTPLTQKLSIRRKFDEFASIIRPEMLTRYENTGQEKLDNRLYDIWQCDNLIGPNGHQILQKCWIDSDTMKIRKIQVYAKPKNGSQEWILEFVRYYEINLPISDDLFVIDIPKNCRRPFDNSTPQTAGLDRLIGSSGFPVHGVYLEPSRACFTLEDGSIIAAWTSSTQKNLKQDVVFEEVVPGDSWPQLPSILEKLNYIPNVGSPGGIPVEVEYQGVHLAHTVLNGMHIEWGLYVPTSQPPIKLPQYIYKTFWRHRDNPDKLHNFNPISGPGIKFREFDEFVLAAMAELNDTGKAPEGISSDLVKTLSGELRRKFRQ